MKNNLLENVLSYGKVIDITIYSNLISRKNPNSPGIVELFHATLSLVDGSTYQCHSETLDDLIVKVHDYLLESNSKYRN